MDLTYIMKQLREPMSSLKPDIEKTRFYFEEVCIKGEPFSMPFLILVTNPCSWLMKSGGCTMCGYSNLASFTKHINGEEIYNQFKRAYGLIKLIPHKMMAIGTAGSFFDSHEVPHKIQRQILTELNQDSEVNYLNLESRVEYLTKEKVKEVANLTNNIHELAIGIGLESANQLIRDKCIHKGLNTQTYLEAVDLLERYDISRNIYILLGKLFLDERTNIEDAVETIDFALENGASRVLLIRCGLQEHTLTYKIHKYRCYYPPSIWSIVEVLNRTRHWGSDKVLLANPQLPKAIQLSFNPGSCNECEQRVSALLIRYKYTNDFKYIEAANKIKCQCKMKWRGIIEAKSKPVGVQIKNGYKILEFISKRVSDAHGYTEI